MVATVEIGLLFCFILLSDKVVLLFNRKIATSQLIFADPDDGFITVCKLFFVDSVRDVGMLLKNCVTVMTVNNQSIPHDDGVDNLAIADDVLFELIQLLRCQRRNLALKLRVNLKRSQFHHRTGLS